MHTTATADEGLRAFHGSQELKDGTLTQVRLHREADEIVKGRYFSEGKGCAVGCMTHNPEGGHDEYPTRWGLPEWLAFLEDRIFESLPIEKAKLWPERFIAAIPVGADFDGLADRLAIRRLKEECLSLSGKWPESIRAQVVGAIEQTIAALESGKEDDLAESARSAWSAAESAESAAESARSAARSARSAESARSARSAAESARSAARSARSAAESARSARSAWSAAESARSARSAFEREADRLIAELEVLPVTGVTAG
jgi:hypothetical protein